MTSFLALNYYMHVLVLKNLSMDTNTLAIYASMQIKKNSRDDNKIRFIPVWFYGDLWDLFDILAHRNCLEW